ncbi:MAG: NCS2 family permease [Candidatus Omnitrophica bacterium]|nr:NCS2 family permease [Candidatus Omnitrophota bacterium]MCM8817302.1 NCS2 family permease [Candidatus Omnitrophota bacterium]
MLGALEKYFKFQERKTSWSTEIRAGITTYLTMAYILFVNPIILKDAGVPFNGCVVGTALAAGITSILMGAITNFPLALAAGMGLNSVLAYSIVIGQGVSWQVGMGLIFLNGLIVFILVLAGLREAVMKAIPVPLRHAIAVGIGMFLAFIGLMHAGIVVINKDTLLPSPGDFSKISTVVSCCGILITSIFVVLRIKGAILLGIVSTAIIAFVAGVSKLPKVVSVPDFSTIGALDLIGAMKLSLLPSLFAFLIVDFFDTLGTVTAIGYQAKLVDSEGNIEKLKEILGIDAIGAMLGGVFGASSNTSYIESAAGIMEGGRTGFTAIVVGILFLSSIIIAPVACLITSEATAPALVIIGFLMMQGIKNIDFDDIETAIPAFIIILTMPFTYSISHGIGYGFITYTVLKMACGKFREVHPLMYIISLVFAAYFVMGK